jgi:hypothetical protein
MQSGDASTTYRDTYRLRNQTTVDDEFKSIVASRMKAQSDGSQTFPSTIDTDPYELIVQRKMQESPGDGQPDAPADPCGATLEDLPPAHPRDSWGDTPPGGGASDGNDYGTAETGDGATGGDTGRTQSRRGPQKRHRRKKAAAREAAQARPEAAARPRAHFGGPAPRFFRHPDHASEAEKPHLYGPFFVAWPKNRPMPSSYAELAQIYGRR